MSADAEIVGRLRQAERDIDRLESLITRPWDLAAPFLSLPGLVGFWPMSSVQRSTGAAYDVSGQGRTLTYNGNPAYTYINNVVPVLNLDGTGDYLSRASETDLNIAGTETIFNASVRGLTALGWVNLTSLASLTGIIGKTNATGNQRSWVLYYSSANARLEFAVSSAGTTYNVVVAGPNITASAWYFLACRMIPSTQSDMFVNMVQYANAASPIASLFASTAALQFGAFDAGANLATGFLGPWALCANALNQPALSLVFQQTRGAFGV